MSLSLLFSTLCKDYHMTYYTVLGCAMNPQISLVLIISSEVAHLPPFLQCQAQHLALSKSQQILVLNCLLNNGTDSC